MKRKQLLPVLVAGLGCLASACAEENAGWSSAAVTTVTDAPSPPVLRAPATFVNTSTPTISGTAESGTTVAVMVDELPPGSSTADASGAWSFIPTPLADGAHTVTAIAVDATGSPSPTSLPLTFMVDTLAPAAPAITAPLAYVNTTTPEIAGTAEIGSDVLMRVDSTMETKLPVSASGTWSLEVRLALGRHTASAQAIDLAGNWSVVRSVDFTIDVEAPAPPVVTAPIDGAFINTAAPVISGTAEWASSTQPGSLVTVQVDGAVVGVTRANLLGRWTLTPNSPLAEGPRILVATATDAAGNSSLASSPLSFTIDTVAPTPPILAVPRNGAVINTATPVISGATESGSTVTVQVDGVMIGTATADATGGWSVGPAAMLAQGSHEVLSRATDAVGNTSMFLSYFTVDTVAPGSPTLTTPADGALLGSATPVFSGTAENDSTVIVTVDDLVAGTARTARTGRWECTLAAPLGRGMHVVMAHAMDAAGNSGPASSPISFNIATVAPATPLISAPADNAVMNTARPAITGIAESGNTVAVELDGIVAGTSIVNTDGGWSYTTAMALGEGRHTVSARATDLAGNSSPAAGPLSITIDTVAPDLPLLTTPANGAVVSTTTPVLSGTAERGSLVSVMLDGSNAVAARVDEAGSWNVTPAIALDEGLHTVTFQATDLAGNASVFSSPQSFTVRLPQSYYGSGCSATSSGGFGAWLLLLGPWLLLKSRRSRGAARPSPVLRAWLLCAALLHPISAQAGDAAGEPRPTFIFPPPTLMIPEIWSPAYGATVNDNTPTISGQAGVGTTVTVWLDGDLAGTATTSNGSIWSLAITTPLDEGLHLLVTQAVLQAGGSSAVSLPQPFTIDTTPPAAPAITGPTGYVNAVQPVISGTAEGGTTVTVSLDGAVAGTTVASESGTWNYTPAVALEPGPHTVSAQVRDAAGNVSPASASLDFSIDCYPPAAPLILIPASGAKVDGPELIISGTAEPDAVVTVSLDDSVTVTVTASEAGTWSFVPTALGEGPHTVSAQATDAAGNRGQPSSPRSFTVSTKPPLTLASPTVLMPAGGAFLNTPTPVISGTAERDVTVSVLVDGVVAGTTAPDPSGNWELVPETGLGEGLHVLAVQALGLEGDSSPPSSPLSFTIDTVAPPPPVLLIPDREAFVTTATPMLAGTTERDTWVAVVLDGTMAGTPMVDEEGNWGFMLPTTLREGVHVVTLQATDAAGNTGPLSSPRSFTVRLLKSYYGSGCSTAPPSSFEIWFLFPGLWAWFRRHRSRRWPRGPRHTPTPAAAAGARPRPC